MNNFLRLWQNEYLLSLRESKTISTRMQSHDLLVVMIKDEVPRGQWKLEILTE